MGGALKANGRKQVYKDAANKTGVKTRGTKPRRKDAGGRIRGKGLYDLVRVWPDF